jgi:hypothetical protein
LLVPGGLYIHDSLRYEPIYMKGSTWGILLLVGLAIFAGGGLMIPTNVRRLAWAIGNAERGPTEISTGNVVRNNPGDIEASGSLLTYTSLTEGWNALYNMIEGWFNGTSKIYDPSMTIYDISSWYVNGSANHTTDSDNWASNVADYLGVDVTTPLSDL